MCAVPSTTESGQPPVLRVDHRYATKGNKTRGTIVLIKRLKRHFEFGTTACDTVPTNIGHRVRISH